ncbi:DoxX family protein [Rhodocaloribacter sp.]
MKYAVLIGRILFSLPFILFGFNHLMKLDAISGYAASHGVPAPTFVTIVTGLMIIAGGLSVMLGYKAKIGAWLLVVFLIPVAFVMHNFWSVEDAMKQNEMAHFLKDLALAGGALLITHFGTGPYSLDERQAETAETPQTA